jgi:hypothetical protein
MRDQHEDFSREISMLRESRPSLTPLELDGAKARVRRRTAGTRGSTWQRFAGTRGAVVALLATGTLMSTGGSALAVSGLGLSGAASTAQYTGTGTTGSSGTGTTPANAVGPAEAVSPEEQAEQPAVTTSGELPFTGFMAIPVLIIGLLFVALGLAGRRVARRPGALPPT